MIRLYGVSIGYGSFARVTAGMKGALERAGLLAGFVPVDQFDPEGAYDGHDAEAGVFVGPPPAVAMMRTIGWHPQRFCLLPPNSSWMPADLLDFVAKHVTAVIAPSKWAEGVMLGYCAPRQLAVSLWQHGVDAGFAPQAKAHDELRNWYAHGRFSVAHLASTARERKGTTELLLGWIDAVRRRALGGNPLLRVVVEDFQGKYEALVEMEAKGNSDILRSIVWGRPRQNMDVAAASAFYQQHHVIAQPSRGEGFGLVPIEALACGVPVVATACTGHADTVHRREAGVVVVPHLDDGPIDDGPDATAPGVAVRDVSDALEKAYDDWLALHDAAYRAAPAQGKSWSWDQVTEDWLARTFAKENPK